MAQILLPLRTRQRAIACAARGYPYPAAFGGFPKRSRFQGVCMAFEVLDEYEQGEVVRKWLRDNAVSMVVGVVLGLALIFGWQQWKAHKARSLVEAAAQHGAYTEALEAGRDADAEKIAAALRENHPDSPSAVFVAMRQAEIASAKQDLETASESLQWAAQHADSVEIRTLANLNLARLHLAEGEADEALALVNAAPQDAYPALLGELRGDALASLGQHDAARTAYETALASLDPQAPERTILQMKLDDQATAGAAATPAPVVEPPAAPVTTPDKQDS